MRRHHVFAATALLLLVTTVAVAQPDSVEPAASPALDFPYSDLAGTSHNLSDLRGGLVLLEFWASWCLPCREGVPFLDRLSTSHESAGLKVLAVTLEDDSVAVDAFVTSHPGRFLVGRDPTGHAAEIFEVAAMPTSILLDPQGKILARFEGGTETAHAHIEAAVEAALRKETQLTGVGAEPAHKRRSTKGLRAWERGYLADPIMSLDGDPLSRLLNEHIHASKEAAAGDGGVTGGGCGCN